MQSSSTALQSDINLFCKEALRKGSCYAAGAQGLTMDQNAVRKVYALQSEDGVRSYWAELENICSTSARSATSL